MEFNKKVEVLREKFGISSKEDLVYLSKSLSGKSVFDTVMYRKVYEDAVKAGTISPTEIIHAMETYILQAFKKVFTGIEDVQSCTFMWSKEKVNAFVVKAAGYVFIFRIMNILNSDELGYLRCFYGLRDEHGIEALNLFVLKEDSKEAKIVNESLTSISELNGSEVDIEKCFVNCGNVYLDRHDSKTEICIYGDDEFTDMNTVLKFDHSVAKNAARLANMKSYYESAWMDYDSQQGEFMVDLPIAFLLNGLLPEPTLVSWSLLKEDRLEFLEKVRSILSSEEAQKILKSIQNYTAYGSDFEAAYNRVMGEFKQKHSNLCYLTDGISDIAFPRHLLTNHSEAWNPANFTSLANTLLSVLLEGADILCYNSPTLLIGDYAIDFQTTTTIKGDNLHSLYTSNNLELKAILPKAIEVTCDYIVRDRLLYLDVDNLTDSYVDYLQACKGINDVDCAKLYKLQGQVKEKVNDITKKLTSADCIIFDKAFNHLADYTESFGLDGDLKEKQFLIGDIIPTKTYLEQHLTSWDMNTLLKKLEEFKSLATGTSVRFIRDTDYNLNIEVTDEHSIGWSYCYPVPEGFSNGLALAEFAEFIEEKIAVGTTKSLDNLLQEFSEKLEHLNVENKYVINRSVVKQGVARMILQKVRVVDGKEEVLEELGSIDFIYSDNVYYTTAFVNRLVMDLSLSLNYPSAKAPTLTNLVYLLKEVYGLECKIVSVSY